MVPNRPAERHVGGRLGDGERGRRRPVPPAGYGAMKRAEASVTFFRGMDSSQ